MKKVNANHSEDSFEEVNLITCLDFERHKGTQCKKKMKAPWAVFLLINTHGDKVLKIHSVVGITNMKMETIEEMFNLVELNPYKQTHPYAGCWVVISWLDGFDNWPLAEKCFHLMHEGTRGIPSRIARGIVLWEKLKDEGINVDLYTIKFTKDEKQKQLQQYIKDDQSIQYSTNA